MTFENLLLEHDGPVTVIAINRPKTFNALNVATIYDLLECFYQLTQQETVRAIVLTGIGEKSFASGADIQEIHDLDLLSGKELSARGNRLFSMIEKMRIPVIAAVNGYALGGGCELAMACHLRIASETAKFGQPEINLGLIPGYGGTQRLPRLVGRCRALELLLTGKIINAQDALAWGLVNAIASPTELLPTARKWAQELSQKPKLAAAAILEAVETGLQFGLDQGLKTEENLFSYCCGTDDMKEGTSAFLNKRKPDFKGR